MAEIKVGLSIDFPNNVNKWRLEGFSRLVEVIVFIPIQFWLVDDTKVECSHFLSFFIHELMLLIDEYRQFPD